MPGNEPHSSSMQRTALRRAADAERSAAEAREWESFSMGRVVCPKHGIGLLFACSEMAGAVHAAGPCPGIEWLAHHADDDPDLVLRY